MRPADLRIRLAGAGLSAAGPTLVVPLAAEAPDPRMADAAVAGADFDAMARSIVDATVYALVSVPVGGPGDVDPVERVVSDLARAGGLGRTTIVVGDPVGVDRSRPDADASRTLTDSLRRCARQLGLVASAVSPAGAGRRVHTARELLVDEVIGTLEPSVRTELTALAAPLAAHDERASTDLVRTLAVHLAHGCSATRSAEVLHIGRQSLYQRVERIRVVLGFDPTEPSVYASMMVALRSLAGGP